MEKTDPWIESIIKQAWVKLRSELERPPSAKEVRNAFVREVQDSRLEENIKIPSLRVVQAILKPLRNAIQDLPESEKKRDLPWNLATIEYPIGSNDLPAIIRVWGYHVENRKMPLTIREAQWVARLHPFYTDTKELAFKAQSFAMFEIMAKQPGATMNWGPVHADLYSLTLGEKITGERRRRFIDSGENEQNVTNNFWQTQGVQDTFSAIGFSKQKEES